MADQENSPYRLLQLFVGNHCLLLGLFTYGGPIPKILKEFLCGGTRVVGLGIDKMAEKLERDCGILIPQRVELRILALVGRACEGKDLSRCNLEAMTRAVLEGEVDVVRPLIKYASVESAEDRHQAVREQEIV